jgi:magnesium-transporting ATPase (P-type)
MENNFNEPQIALPNSTLILVLGIISIIGCCCYAIPGLILSVIALVLGNSSKKLYVSSPEKYTESSYNNVNAGKICSIISLILSILFIILMVCFALYMVSNGITNEDLLKEWLQNQGYPVNY